MDQTKKRNGRIDFFRFVFSLIVLIFHGQLVMNDEKIRIMFSGRLGVEFFFLVSGYFMASALEKAAAALPQTGVAGATEKYIFSKIKSFYPILFFSYLMNILTEYIRENPDFKTIFKYSLERLPNLFLVDQTGIFFESMNGTWFLSSMIIAMVILYPLGLKYYNYMKKIGFMFVSVIILGYMMSFLNALSGPEKLLNNITFRGNLRAAAEISLGAVCYQAANYLKKIKFTGFGRLVLGFTELTMYSASILYMVFHKGSRYDYLILFFLAAGVTLTFSERNYNSKIWDRPVFTFMGKASLYIYLAHMNIARDLTFITGQDANNKERMVLYILLSFAYTAVLWAVCQIRRRNYGKIRKIFISSS